MAGDRTIEAYVADGPSLVSWIDCPVIPFGPLRLYPMAIALLRPYAFVQSDAAESVFEELRCREGAGWPEWAFEELRGELDASSRPQAKP